MTDPKERDVEFVKKALTLTLDRKLGWAPQRPEGYDVQLNDTQRIFVSQQTRPALVQLVEKHQGYAHIDEIDAGRLNDTLYKAIVAQNTPRLVPDVDAALSTVTALGA